MAIKILRDFHGYLYEISGSKSNGYEARRKRRMMVEFSKSLQQSPCIKGAAYGDEKSQTYSFTLVQKLHRASLQLVAFEGHLRTLEGTLNALNTVLMPWRIATAVRLRD